MASRRDLLRALISSAAAGIAGCNAPAGRPEQGRTRTTVLTPEPTSSRSPTSSPATATRSHTGTTTSTSATTGTPTETMAEAINTPAYRPGGEVTEFGHAVSLTTRTAIVAAEEHGAFVFEAGDEGWSNTARLTPAERDDFGGLGVSASLVGDRAVVSGPQAGAAYLFERTDDGWSQTHRFEADDPVAGEFGRSVAYDGDRVVVGDANEPTTMVSYVGGAYIYVRDGDGWTREATLTTGEEDLFGTAVAVDGRRAVVGAPFANPHGERAGAAYVFERVDGGWEREAVLSPADLSSISYDGRFGDAVALDGDIAVIGAPEIPRGSGRAYVFERTDAGWRQAAHLAARDLSEGAEFGRSVALHGRRVVVGAPRAHESGRAYLFAGTYASADPLRLAAADLPDAAEFGAAVSLSGEAALVGAPAYDLATGAYLFDA